MRRVELTDVHAQTFEDQLFMTMRTDVRIEQGKMPYLLGVHWVDWGRLGARLAVMSTIDDRY